MVHAAEKRTEDELLSILGCPPGGKFYHFTTDTTTILLGQLVKLLHASIARSNQQESFGDWAPDPSLI